MTDGAGPCRDRDVKAIKERIGENIEAWRNPLDSNTSKLNSLIITESEVFHWTSEPIQQLAASVNDEFKNANMLRGSRSTEDDPTKIVEIVEVEEFHEIHNDMIDFMFPKEEAAE